MASIYQVNGWWYARYELNGKLIRKSLRTQNKVIATEALEDIKAALRYNLIGIPLKSNNIPTFNELFDDYLRYMKVHRQPRTYKHAELYIRLFLRPAFGHIRADQLTDIHIEDFVGKLLNRKIVQPDGIEISSPYHPETINKRLKCLRKVLTRSARPGGVLDKIPVDVSAHLLKVPKPLPKYVTPERFAKWWVCINKPINRWRAVIALNTGMPDSELARLRWDQNYIGKPAALRYWRKKTGTEIYVVLNEWAREAISHLVKMKNGPYIFHGIKEVERAYEVASHKSGVKVTPHMLRHSFATWALSAGELMQKIQQIMGHADISTTQRYAKVIPQFLAETTDAIVRMRPKALQPSTKRSYSKKQKWPLLKKRP